MVRLGPLYDNKSSRDPDTVSDYFLNTVTTAVKRKGLNASTVLIYDVVKEVAK